VPGTVLVAYVRRAGELHFVGGWPNDDAEGFTEALLDHWLTRDKAGLIIVDQLTVVEQFAVIGAEVYSLQKRVEKLERRIENANR
jgi:hypothetical protein